MLPAGPGGFSETSYIDHTTERQEELLEGLLEAPVGRESMPGLHAEGRQRPGPRSLKGTALYAGMG